jgi:hypothetical protein
LVQPSTEEGGWEQIINTKTGVWVGAGGAEFSARFSSLKYSIEHGLLSQPRRVCSFRPYSAAP